MAEQNAAPGSFEVKDCALVAIALAHKVQNLREMRDHLLKIHPGSIYYHFWGGLLRPQFAYPEYYNDFAGWVHYSLHDDTLAERLAILDPTNYPDLESLRGELVDLVEERLDEVEWLSWTRADQEFHFVRSQILVFDTQKRIEEPLELASAVSRMSAGSIFYHYIDARRRSADSMDDLRSWLMGFGESYANLCRRLASVDPYFRSLPELRHQLTRLFATFFEGASL
ncbi:MAG: DUF5752 family protein [Desulfomonilaceae bacterium]